MQYEITPNVPGQWYIYIKGSHTEPPIALFYRLEAAEAFIAAHNAEKVAEQEPLKSFQVAHYDAFTEAHKQVAVEVDALRETLGITATPQQPAETVAEVTCIHPIVCEHAFLDDDGRWNCAQCMSAKGE